MKVRQIMNSDVEHGTRGMNLAEAAGIMWHRDCGMIPIVDDQRRVLGVITDRDICMAVATRPERAEHITVGQVMDRGVHTVRPDADVRTALELMQRELVRRLPVTDAVGVLRGILSISDVVRNVRTEFRRNDGGLDAPEVLRALQHIVQPREAHAALQAG